MGYDLNRNGRIKNPGKFEGETLFTLALYDASMHGASDETFDVGDTAFDVFEAPFHITADLSPVVTDPQYHEPSAAYAVVYTDNAGFAYSLTFPTEARFLAWRAEIEATDESDGE